MKAMKKEKLFTRNFTLLILGQVSSLTGNYTLKFALSMYVLEQTGSASIFAGMLSAALLPTVLLSPFGGILADRANRKHIMVALDTLSGLSVLAAGLLLPALTLEDSYLRIDPSPPERTSAVRLEEITPASGGMEMDMAEALQQEFGEPPKMNPVVQFILGAVLCVIGGGFGVYLLYLVIRNFRGTFVDQRDVVQFLGRDTEDEEEPLPQERVRGPAVWDRSPNAQVRRKYRRAVLRSAKEAPPQWASPQEIETRAGLEDRQLHRLYEKARYSQEGCTSQESRSLKR